MLRVPNSEVLLPGIVMQACCNFYYSVHTFKDIYIKIADVSFYLGIVMYVVGLFFFLLPFFDGRKKSDCLKNMSEVNGFANIGIYLVLASHYICEKYESARVGYSWFSFICCIIYMYFYLYCWMKYYKSYKINLTLIGPYLLFFNPVMDLWNSGDLVPFSLFVFSADFIWLAMEVIIIYILITDPTQLNPIIGLGAFMICFYMHYTFLPIVLAFPLTYAVIVALKNKTLDADQGIVAFTAYWVAFAVLFKLPNKVCLTESGFNQRCDDVRGVFSVIGHIGSWIALLVLLILMIPSICDSPLDAFIKPPHVVVPKTDITSVNTTVTTITMPTENVDDIKVVVVNKN